MKTNSTLFCLTVAGLLTNTAVRADSFINDFSVSFDYAANGIIGDTNWDGVYLRFGDVPNGSPGGSGNGNTPVANTTAFGGGFLGIQNVGGDWSGNDDDGFFIYKMVTGDFDASVDNVPATLSGGTGFDNRGNNFTGLMIRLANTNNSGGAFSTTSTNRTENSLRLMRFDEFALDGEIRQSTNGANFENTYPLGGNSFFNTDTNTPRSFRITRSGDTFSFYIRTNSSDPWFLMTNASNGGGYVRASGSVTRADWAGLPVQVGICQAAFSTASRDAIYDNFALSGPNVTFPALPAGAPSGLVTTATNTGGSLALSWNVGTPGDGSLVVISRHPIQHNPVQGVTYSANSSYGDTNTLLGGGGQFVVYNGTGTSVTVTNLGANNINYNVAVYEYTPGASPIYNTASPVTNGFAGPGIITGATLVANKNNIPVGGAVALQLLANFSTGETSDQTANSSWGSSDPSIASVNAAGTVSGVAPGTATITATFGPYSPSTNITVHAPAFTDNFSITNDYTTNGLIGTRFDGLFLNFGDVPGAVAGADGNGAIIAMDSQITSTNGLFMNSVQSTWSSASDDGPFLYKVVPGSVNGASGDFQVSVHINNMNNLNGVFAGLMARLYNPANHGPGPGGVENHVNYWKQQNGATSIRRTQAGAGGGTVLATGPNAADGWLLLQRVNSTNFYFFEKANAGDPWTLVTSTTLVAASNNAPMEVGIAQQSTAGVNALTTYDSFELDADGVITATTPPAAAGNFNLSLNGNLSMTLSYDVGTNADGSAIRAVVVMRDGGPVTAQPYTGVGLAGPAGPPFAFGDVNNSVGGGNYVIYRSVAGDTHTNQSIVINNLIPGHTYYAAVYTFVGLGTTRTFNQDATTAHGSLQDGVLQFLEALPTPPIASGGIGFMQVLGHYTGGAVLNVSPFATITSANTNIIKVLNGILTGISNGTANVTLVYSGVTNTAAVTVRNPGFVDSFSTAHDYLASGVAGTGWQELYNPSPLTNPVPSSPYVPLPGSGATVADANISTNNALTISSAGDGWENDLSGGFFLFRYVPGDFQMAVHVQSFDILTYNQPGLLARAYAVDTNGNVGAPFGLAVPNANGTNDAGEYWVSLARFDEFNIGTYARRNIDSGVSQNGQTDPGPTAINGPTGPDTNYWLLIVRSQGTEFDFYKRSSLTDTWRQVPNKTHYSLPQFAGQPMQAGIMAGPWSNPAGATRTVRFDSFMLDTTTGSKLQITKSGGNIVLSWPAIPNAILQSTGSLNPVNWQNVPGTPALGPQGYSLTLPQGPGTQFFRLVQ
jgi:hypothetical protein